jgi:hypothetical protein
VAISISNIWASQMVRLLRFFSQDTKNSFGLGWRHGQAQPEKETQQTLQQEENIRLDGPRRGPDAEGHA